MQGINDIIKAVKAIRPDVKSSELSTYFQSIGHSVSEYTVRGILSHHNRKN